MTICFVSLKVAVAETHHPDVQALLDTELPAHPDLTIGHLENGLRYVILPNKSPPDRMEVHLEVHAGAWISPCPPLSIPLPQNSLLVLQGP